MSESAQPVPPPDLPEGEEFDALPVLSGTARVAQARPATATLAEQRAGGVVTIPTVQAAAAAAGGFVAGAAVLGLVHRRHKRSAARALWRGGRDRSRRGGMAGDLIQVVGSRSLLLDVHLLGRPGDR